MASGSERHRAYNAAGQPGRRRGNTGAARRRPVRNTQEELGTPF